MLMLNLISVIPICLLAIVTLILERDWCSPGAFFSIVWSVFCLLPILFAPEEYVSPWAMAYITMTATAVVMGSGLSRMIMGAKKHAIAIPIQVDHNRLKNALVFTTLVGFGFVPAVLWAEGFSLLQLFDMNELPKIVLHFVTGRYSGTLTEPWFSRPSLVCVYLSPLLGGIVMSETNSRPVAIKYALFTILPAVAITALRSEKWPTTVAIGLFTAAYLTCQLASKRPTSWTFRGAIKVGITVFVIIIAFSFSQYSRIMGDDSDYVIDIVIAKMYSNAFSHLTVFSFWFEKNALEIQPTFGAYTLPGLFDLLGINNRIPGLYDDFVTLSNGETSNLHTIFRPTIQDLTLPGSIVAFCVFGFVARCSYINLTRPSAFVFYICFLGIVLLSFNMNILGSNSILFSFIMLIPLIISMSSSKKHK